MRKIFKGFCSWLWPNGYVKAIREKRLAQCDKCMYQAKFLGLDVCDYCHCVLKAKTSCLECSCPIGNWNAVNDLL